MQNPTTKTSEVADNATSGSLVARLDRLPTGGIHVFWAVLLGIAYVVETFDNTVFSYTAPTIMAEWGLNLPQIGIITSAVFIGMFLGALVGGRAADRFGRKPVLIWASVFYSAMSLLSAIAPNFEVLFLSRVLTGLGVQAATGVVIVYLSEMFPRATRGRFFTIVTLAGALSAPVTAFLAKLIVPQGLDAWRWMFVIGSVGIVVAVAVAFGLPESVRWLSSHGRTPRADSIVTRMETRAVTRGPLPPVEVEEGTVAEKQGSFRDLFKAVYGRRLVVLGSSFFLLVFGLYGFQAWLTTMLVQRGLSQSDALGIVGLATLGTVAGPVLLFAFADKIERRTAVLIEGGMAALGVILFSISAAVPQLTVVSAFMVCAAIMAGTTTWYTYMPEAFPTSVRGIAAGTVSGIGRIAGILQGILMAALLQGIGETMTMYILAAVFLAMGFLALLGPKATRRSLEEISHG
jgi:putative MFS transporter